MKKTVGRLSVTLGVMVAVIAPVAGTATAVVIDPPNRGTAS
jgi:hypothetical protein